MKIKLSILLTILLGAAFMLTSCDEGPHLSDDEPVYTGNADDITATYAHMHGKALPTATMVGFAYSTNYDDMRAKRAEIVSQDGNGNFAIGVDNLLSGTTYYYCALALIGGREYAGEIRSFNTPRMEGDFVLKSKVVSTDYTSVRIRFISKYNVASGFKLGVFFTDEEGGEPSATNKKWFTESTINNIDGDGYYDDIWGYSGLEVAKTYNYRPYIYDFQTKEYTYGDMGTFTTRDVTAGKYVDMGLNVAWARCNLGAKSPEEMGDRYAFGEMEPKEEYTKENYLFQNNELAQKDIAGTAFDVATYQLGKGWQIPIADHYRALLRGPMVEAEETCYKGVKGTLCTSKTNGNAVFIPGKETQYMKSYNTGTPHEGYYVRAVYSR